MKRHLCASASTFGRLDKALDAEALNKWLVADMKNDCQRIFAIE
jgi:hypothetical protein